MSDKFNLSIRILWSTVSKAFNKSIKTPVIFWLKESYMPLRMWSLEWSFLKPNYLWEKGYFVG